MIGFIDVQVVRQFYLNSNDDDTVLFAEQECHLTITEVNTRHLDQEPGFKIEAKGAESCDDTSKLTSLEQCDEARLALDWKADAVQEKDDGTLPTGCYRQQEAEYRLLHSKSSYVWYFNVAVNGQSDPNSEPVCQGKAKRSWHMCSYSRQ